MLVPHESGRFLAHVCASPGPVCYWLLSCRAHFTIADCTSMQAVHKCRHVLQGCSEGVALLCRAPSADAQSFTRTHAVRSSARCVTEASARTSCLPAIIKVRVKTEVYTLYLLVIVLRVYEEHVRFGQRRQAISSWQLQCMRLSQGQTSRDCSTGVQRLIESMDGAGVDVIVYPTWSNVARLVGDYITPDGAPPTHPTCMHRRHLLNACCMPMAMNPGLPWWCARLTRSKRSACDSACELLLDNRLGLADGQGGCV